MPDWAGSRSFLRYGQYFKKSGMTARSDVTKGLGEPRNALDAGWLGAYKNPQAEWRGDDSIRSRDFSFSFLPGGFKHVWPSNYNGHGYGCLQMHRRSRSGNWSY